MPRAKPRPPTPVTTDPLPERTGTARFAAALLEACLLVALVITPTFFNPKTQRVFEPDKLAWLEVLAFVALWALIVHAAEDGRFRLEMLRPSQWTPIAAAGMLVGVALVVGTVASIVPIVSLWGSYFRAQGILAYGAYLVFFAAALVAARRPATLDRVRRAVLVAAVPVAMYAVFQRLRIDSISWDIYGEGATVRAFGTLGNAIFLGAYLLAVIPLAWVGLVQAFGELRQGDRAAWRPLVGHSLVAILALAGMLAAQSRGPVLGLMVAAGFLVIMWAVRVGRRRLVLGLAAAGLVAVVGAALVGRSATAPLGRLGALFDPASRTALERRYVWQALEQTVADSPTRALIGYGPDTTYFAMQRHVSDELVRLTPQQVFDRTHNVLWEWWVSAGLLGVLALLGAYAAAFLTGFGALGWVRSRGDALVAVGFMALGALVGLVVPRLAGEAPLSAVGVAFGWLGGALLVPVWHVARREVMDARQATVDTQSDSAKKPNAAPAQPKGASELSGGAWLVMGLLAALAAHLADGAVGLPSAAGELLFWVYLGLLVPASRLLAEADHGAAAAGAQPAERPKPYADAVWVGLALATVLFAPLLQPNLAGAGGKGAGLWLILPGVWLVAHLLAPSLPAERRESFGQQVGRLLGPTLLGTGGVLVVFGGLMGVMNEPMAGATIAFGLTFLAAVAALTFLLMVGRDALGAGETWRWLPYASLALLAVAFGWRLALVPVAADLQLRAGLQSGVDNNAAGMLAHFERAADTWPEQPTYATYLAGAYLQKALDSKTATMDRLASFASGEAVLKASYAQAPNDQLASRLATLLRTEGDTSTNLNQRQQYWTQAGEYYTLALSQFPRNPETLAEYGALLERTELYTEALRVDTDVFRLNPANDDAAAGRIRVALALADVTAAQQALDEMLAVHETNRDVVEQAIQRGEALPAGPLRARQSKVLYLFSTGKKTEGLTLFEQLNKEAPDDPGTAALRAWLAKQSM